MSDQEFRLDYGRIDRIGLPEAILAAWKSDAQLDAILTEAGARGRSLLLTRVAAKQAATLTVKHPLDYDAVSQTAFFLEPAPLRTGTAVAVITAGSSDVPVALEAIRTLRFLGVPALVFHDLGVAGLWRLQQQLEPLRSCAVVIVAAGMDGALPTVVAGLVPGCVIAVPTSTGYGMANAGETALRAALASCASGLLVVNIDNGYGAACAAVRILRQLDAR